MIIKKKLWERRSNLSLKMVTITLDKLQEKNIMAKENTFLNKMDKFFKVHGFKESFMDKEGE